MTYPGGFNNNQNGGHAVLPVGDHIITYTAYDWCGNSSSINMTVTV
ncbi:MAG: HYR domain-containing protein [Saprospiraceae bacterium]|nr:HYR domain-containing protein [Saprospiraceae bacterium]